jgi:hypothetical protein
MIEHRKAGGAVALAVVLVSLAACSDTTSPGIQPEINNLPDNFQYQVTDVRNYTHTDSYPWQNTGTQANVNQSTTVTGGTATLAILDADGTEVYNRSLAENGTFTTAGGASGTWTVRVIYVEANANVNFRVQKST